MTNEQILTKAIEKAQANGCIWGSIWVFKFVGYFILVFVLPAAALLALAGLIVGLANGDWSWFR